jgi:hypothetical protein
MPAPGTAWSGADWATGGGFLPRPHAVSSGARARYRTVASGGNSDIPRDFMKVSVAADIAVRVRQSVLRERPEQDLGARCAPDEEIIEIMGARTRYFLA